MMKTNSFDNDYMTLLLDNISKSFGKKQVLKDINYSFKEQNSYLIIGKNGSGKSTLINIIGNEIKADSGEVLLFYNIDNTLDNNKNISIQFQDFNCFPFLKVKEVISLFKTIVLDCYYSETLYNILNLNNIKDTQINKLSGGEKKAISLFLSFMLNKKVMILDEPFSDLDIDKKEQLKQYISDYIKKVEKMVLFQS